MQAAIVHMIGDLLQSVGVIIASIVIIYEPKWLIVDPICTFIFSVLVMFTTIPTFSKCIGILMEGTPEDVNVDKLKTEVLKISSVTGL
jgi:zinc transporter 2